MNILKKDILWFVLYGILITGAFLYLLFPSDLVKSRLEQAFAASAYILKTESVKPSLPLGLKFKDISVRSASADSIPFQGKRLNLQFNPLSLFQKNKSFGFSGEAYGGRFKGRVGVASLSRFYPFQEGHLNLRDIDLGKYAFLKTLMEKEITGKATGALTYAAADKKSKSSGMINLVLHKGSYPLLEPFLGMNRVDFDIVEIKARLLDKSIILEKFSVSGPQLKYSLSGEITLADSFKESSLNLKGDLELLGRNKAKMKVTVVGTMKNPELRYI
ncbi:MAG: type II secretion system protein GspN [Smithella sp.]